jgi:hypothetical protein
MHGDTRIRGHMEGRDHIAKQKTRESSSKVRLTLIATCSLEN